MNNRDAGERAFLTGSVKAVELPLLECVESASCMVYQGAEGVDIRTNRLYDTTKTCSDVLLESCRD